METDCGSYRSKTALTENGMWLQPHITHAIKCMLSCCAARKIMTKTLSTAGSMRSLHPKISRETRKVKHVGKDAELDLPSRSWEAEVINSLVISVI